MAFILCDIQEIMAEVFGVEPEAITIDASPDTIESWDSLRLLNLILALEQEFGVEFPSDQLQHLMSVEKILHALNQAVAGRRP
jgi:acyl carrier protein